MMILYSWILYQAFPKNKDIFLCNHNIIIILKIIKNNSVTPVHVQKCLIVFEPGLNQGLCISFGYYVSLSLI